MSTSKGEQVVGVGRPSSQMIGVNEVTPMDKPERQEQSAPTPSQAADLRARLGGIRKVGELEPIQYL
jgi:hypothetical protein